MKSVIPGALALVASIALSHGVPAYAGADVPSPTARDYYHDRGTTLPRSIAADPMGSPYSTGVTGSGLSLGSTATLSREARGAHDARIRSEQDARDQRLEAWRNPPLRFDIAPPDMPKPDTED